MDELLDPTRGVMDAVEDLRRVFHARDWRDNRRWVGEPSEIKPSWKQFEQALAAAHDVIYEPKPGQGLASIWLKAVALQAFRVENDLDEYAENWQQLLFYKNDVLNVLLEACWEKGCYILGFGKSKRRPIARALLQPVPALTKLRTLAANWQADYPSADDGMSQQWREAREKYVQQAAQYLLEAVNQLEVTREVIDDDFCTRICNDINEPENVVWPRILEESPDSLFELADWLAGEKKAHQELPAIDSTDTKSPMGQNPYLAPDLYARDKWVYENIDLNTHRALSLALEDRAKVEHWETLSWRNAFKKSADRYADYHGLPRKAFKGAKRKPM
jgi:hypothetical protein